MGSFEIIGSMQLLAYEGQRQIARAFARACRTALVGMVNGLVRHLPEGRMAPW